MAKGYQQELLAEMRAIREDLSEAATNLAVVNERQTEMAKTLARLDLSINGNGKPGLKATVEEQGDLIAAFTTSFGDGHSGSFAEHHRR